MADKKRRVLVVDDSELCLEVARNTLEQGGYEVSTLANSLELASRLRELQPDLVLLDVTMPGIPGPELLRIALRSHSVSCPVLLHSDRPEEELSRLARSCGADGFIKKGEPDGTMLRQVRRMIFSAMTAAASA